MFFEFSFNFKALQYYLLVCSAGGSGYNPLIPVILKYYEKVECIQNLGC